MSKRLTRGWLVRAGIASAMGAAAIMAVVTIGAFGAATHAAPLDMTMTVSGGGNQAVLGATFNVDVNATNNAVTVANPWAGWATDLWYNPAILQVVSSVATGGGLCPPSSYGVSGNAVPTTTPLGVAFQSACVFQASTAQSPPPMDTIEFQCIAMGTSALHLIGVTLAEDPISGSTFIDGNAVVIPTDLVDGSVNCNLGITKTNDAPAGVAVAGTTVNYTIHVTNPLAVSLHGLVVGDLVPVPLTGAAVVSSTNGNVPNPWSPISGDTCSVIVVGPPAQIACVNATALPGTGFDLVVSGFVPLSAAGTNNICNQAQLSPTSGPVSNVSCFNVAPSHLTVTKVADALSYAAGDPISWTLTVTSDGASPATGVVVTDTPTDGFTATANTGSANCLVATATTWNCGTLAASDGPQTLTISGTVNSSAPSDQTCDNTVNVASTNGASATASAATACKPPFPVVGMVKLPHGGDYFTYTALISSTTDVGSLGTVNTAGSLFNIKPDGVNGLTVGQVIGVTIIGAASPGMNGTFMATVTGPNSFTIVTSAGASSAPAGGIAAFTPLDNLWLCKGATCTGNGMGHDTIDEFFVPVTTAGSDPDGVGAFEFQLKYDNHIFDISISATGWLYSTGRVPGATGIGGCSSTIITENDIRFGCVSKNPNPPAVVTGVNSAGVAATITLTPKADLVNRITPGNNNGAIRTLLDEGCELADIWGHPLSLADGSGTGPGYDALGREIPLPGILPGGQVIDCRDKTITVRILEGDMNLDCTVDVADDQWEASHYGATFGNLLYEPWFDLEPGLRDGDVDIKDLQKVFGRNGSTCANPIPNQPALPEPVDP